MSDTIKLYIYVALIVLIWSTAYTLMYYVVGIGGFPYAWVPAARIAIPAIGITGFVYVSGKRLPKLTDTRWLWYGLMGFLGMTAPFYLLAKGNSLGVESGISSILTNGVTPLFVILLAHFFVKSEHLTTRKAIGFLIGFIGVAALYLPEHFDWSLVSNWQAQSYILLVALSFAFAAIVAKRAPPTDASIGAAIMLITAGLTAIVLAAPSGLPHGEFKSGVMLALFALSIFSTGLSDILYLKVIQLSGPSMIAKINYLVPIFAVGFGIVFLNENFSWRTIAAMMVIITGLLIARNDEDDNWDLDQEIKEGIKSGT